jgi:sphinganine-1-phosphate aldolase
MHLPATGTPKDDLLARMRDLKMQDTRWKEGRAFSLVYWAGEQHHDVLKEAHELFFAENGLNPMAFKSLQKMEKDVVRMTTSLFHGGPDVVGTMTSGGTESLLLAVKTARDRARAKRPWITRPELVLPETAHVAFDKACHYFGVKARYAPIGKDLKVDVRALKKLVNRNTILIAASAPQYPHGVMDPIEEIGAFAKKRGLSFHVDACIGGFVTPFLEKLGERVPLWDFRVDGVTSISADLHKYGYAAKGASVLLYANMDHLKHQFFVSTDFPGGIYASPSIPGTRPGGPIAAAWAAMMSLGEEGYLALTKQALEAKARLVAGVSRIDGLRVLGAPETTLFAWTTSDPRLDAYAVADVLQDRGWHVDRQHRPACIHLTVMPQHLPVVDDYLNDLADAVAIVRADPAKKARGDAAMYGMMGKLPFRGTVKAAVLDVMQRMHGPGDGGMDPSSAGGGVVKKLLDEHGELVGAVLDRVDAVRGKFMKGRRSA